MLLHTVFERCVLDQVRRRCPPRTTGRPRHIDDATALALIFKVVRTGMQWREVHRDGSYKTLFRTMRLWADADVFAAAYKRVLAVHRKLCPPTYYCVDSGAACRRRLLLARLPTSAASTGRQWTGCNRCCA